jgi:hypothetical protein
MIFSVPVAHSTRIPDNSAVICGGIRMSDLPGTPVGPRRDEDVALDLMKFVAMTTGYGKTSGPGAGFQGTGAPVRAEDYADHLLQLYTRCLETVRGKK